MELAGSVHSRSLLEIASTGSAVLGLNLVKNQVIDTLSSRLTFPLEFEACSKSLFVHDCRQEFPSIRYHKLLR